MSLFKKISGLFGGAKPGFKGGSFEIAVRCSRCGEVIRTRIDLTHDLSAEYGERNDEVSYFCRKVLIGKQSCYFPIEVGLNFDAERDLIDHQIRGGTLVEK